ncbi:S1 family peptidase [Amycolatopsis mongoliensis]|uniref:S1 family peptidase n=1 Tax=Amycolatopsis mongoliensis TaxID=715475 RepID=UPI0038CC061B
MVPDTGRSIGRHRPAGKFPGTGDFSLLTYNNTATKAPSVVDVGGGRTVAITKAAAAKANQQVLRMGSTTGLHQGRVTSLNATVNCPEGRVTGLIRTTVCAESGDSGGPLFTRDGSAIGITSGGSGNCRTGGVTFFQPVAAAPPRRRSQHRRMTPPPTCARGWAARPVRCAGDVQHRTGLPQSDLTTRRRTGNRAQHVDRAATRSSTLGDPSAVCGTSELSRPCTAGTWRPSRWRPLPPLENSKGSEPVLGVRSRSSAPGSRTPAGPCTGGSHPSLQRHASSRGGGWPRRRLGLEACLATPRFNRIRGRSQRRRYR